MGIKPVCPECGFKSGEMRCPRCNALKIEACSGACMTCGHHKSCQQGFALSAPDQMAGTKRTL